MSSLVSGDIPPPLLHEPRGTAPRPRRLPALLQPRAAPPRVPTPRPDTCGPLLGCDCVMMWHTTLDPSRCQHHFESGHSRPVRPTLSSVASNHLPPCPSVAISRSRPIVVISHCEARTRG